MIASAKKTRRRRLTANSQDRFLSMLPAIEHQVAHRLRGVPAHDVSDLVQGACARVAHLSGDKHNKLSPPTQMNSKPLSTKGHYR